MLIPLPQEEEEPLSKEEEVAIPPFGTVEYIQYCSIAEGDLPSPIPVSITGSTMIQCPDLKWYNFDIYPHKVKLTNTGFTVLMGAKWRTERPYLEGGPLLEKHVFSQIHFHWGAHMMEGSDHVVDSRYYPVEMQVTFFKSDYLTQQEALLHPDGVMMICYVIKPSEERDERLDWVLEGFSRIKEAKTNTRIGPMPLSKLLPMFCEDYFLYWGALKTVKGDSYKVRWVIPRTTLHATQEQITWFRKLWNPWDEFNRSNYRPLQERGDRHVFLIRPHWNLYNSLLPLPRVPEIFTTELSPAYQANPWMLPIQNRLPEEETTLDNQEYSKSDTREDVDTIISG